MLCTPVTAKISLKCWVFLGELQKFIFLFVNVMWLTFCPFLKNHLLWAWHQFVPGWGLHTEWSPKSIVLEVPITSMQLNFTCRTFVYMTTYLFSFLTFNSTQNILDQFFTRWALANYTHMETLPISRVCLGANPSSLWVSVCFCERCYNIYFMQICMDILDHPWLLFTWYMVLQNILLELLCFLMFINFHSLIRGLLPPSSLACGPLKLETNTWKVNCQGVSDAMYLVRVFGFGVACLGILGGSRKSPRPLRYLESFWMQLFHSTLYLIYLIQTRPPWNTYHNSVKKKADTSINLQFCQRIRESKNTSLDVSSIYGLCGIFLECFVSGRIFQMWTWVKDHKTIDIG